MPKQFLEKRCKMISETLLHIGPAQIFRQTCTDATDTDGAAPTANHRTHDVDIMHAAVDDGRNRIHRLRCSRKRRAQATRANTRTGVARPNHRDEV